MTDLINNTVVTWLGRDISTMSREELEIAFRQLGTAYQDELITAENRMKSSVDEMFKLAASRRNGIIRNPNHIYTGEINPDNVTWSAANPTKHFGS